jgi:putative glutamine amidotransferase
MASPPQRYTGLVDSPVKVALPFGVSTPEEKRVWYRNALLAAGMQPIEDARALDGAAGLLLAGGADVEPSLYGEPRDARTEQPDAERDRIECALLGEALERDIPVFAICRGLQLMNAALGGKLTQHVDGHSQRKVRDAHEVAIAPSTRLASILGEGRYLVNSRHHQCARVPAPGLVVSAVAPDGVIEALELPGKRFALAVQWHPEARMDGADAKLLQAFRAAIR